MKVSHSRIDSYRRCPRKYWWEYEQGLVPRRDSVPLLVGDAVHRGLAAHYSAKSKADITKAAAGAFDETRERGKWLEGELSDIAAQQQYVELVLQWYREEYPKEDWTVLAPEVQGHAPLGKHQFFFRADGLVSWRGFLWVLENKTTAALGDIFFKRFRLDGQITAYIWGAWQKLGSLPKGVIINVIRKSKKLDRADFARDVALRTERQVVSYMTQVEHELDVIEQLDPAVKEQWTMHTHECIAFNRTCNYIDLCERDRPEARAGFMDRLPNYVDLGGD